MIAPDDLYPSRLPETFAAVQWPDLLAGFALGLLAALAVHAVIGPAFRKRPRRPTLDQRLAAMRDLPADARLVAQLHLLSDLRGTVPDGLYTGPAPDLAAMIRKTADA